MHKQSWSATSSPYGASGQIGKGIVTQIVCLYSFVQLEQPQ